MRGAGLRTLSCGLIIGISLGFVLANTFYRANGAEKGSLSLLTQVQTGTSAPLINSSQQTIEPAKSANQTNRNENILSADELHHAIVKADADKGNLPLQRNLGIALFRYAALEQKTDLLPHAVRLLKRADQESFLKDKELHEVLGDALFVLAQQGEPQKMSLAREAYRKALRIDPKNPDLIVNIGLTYFLEQPSNPSAAILLYNQALSLHPTLEGNEKALENLTIALLSLGQTVKAAQTLKELQLVNPQNKAISDLQTQITQRQLTKQ
jgi:tetratricopeptide (TPR) repeat protein